MRIAFYAPLKSPDHPVPSGDRQLARSLMRALRSRGHDVALASRFRSFDRAGDAARQARLAQLGTRLADRLLARYRHSEAPPELWFTYHVWHKAPDFLGSRISAALAIPYVVVEASVAPKQRHGRWALGYEHARAAIERADAVVALNPVDRGELERVTRSVEFLPPFIDVPGFTAATRRSPRAPGPVRLVTIAMMREGAKLASYRVLARALAQLADLAWELEIIGDGAARDDVNVAFATFPPDRVRFLGALGAAEIAQRLHHADLFAWPAVGEALGIVFLEAQACGLPVVAGRAGGVPAVVAEGRTGLLVAEGDADAFAVALRTLIVDTELRESFGSESRAYVLAHHDVPAAAQRLDRILQQATNRRR